MKYRLSSTITPSPALTVLAVLALLAAWPATAQTASGKPLKVAFFGFDLINTSLEPIQDVEKQRIAMVGEVLRQMLADSGRYQIVPLSDELKQKVAQSPDITGCNGCQIDWARQADADLAVWGTVQKVSNLILNLNVYMDGTKDGHQYFGRSVDIRGNTDESWQRGVQYLVRHYLLDEK
jgi:Protein of unknown function (DUF2380)